MMHKAGTPSQCARQELTTLPRNNHDMECPKPQPGHQVNPIAFKGQRLKCAGPAGSANASVIMAPIQNASSKYLEKRRLSNFF
jgi:hypothetical protein